MSQAIYQAMEIKAQDPTAPTMPEMPEFADPFQAMLWVIYVQMPAALDVKQYGLGSLSTSLSKMSEYQKELSGVQDIFNEFYNARYKPEDENTRQANTLLSNLQSLIKSVETGDYIEGGLKDEILTSLKRFHSESTTGFNKGGWRYFYDIWAMSSAGHKDYLEKGNFYRDELRKRLNDLDIAGSGFKSSSSQTQALYQYDTEDYKSWVGLTQKMMKEFFSQVGAPIRESLNSVK